MKVFTGFIKKKHVGDISPNILAASSQKGGVIVATETGFYRVEKIEDSPDGFEYQDIVLDEATSL